MRNPILRSSFAAAALLALAALSAPRAEAQLISDVNELPPPDGVYLSPSDVHAMYTGPALAVLLSKVEHSRFTQVEHITSGADEIENFNSVVQGRVSINGGPDQPIVLTGPVSVLSVGRAANQLGTYPTEMLSMMMAGGGVMIRESPTLASLGQTTVAPLPNGKFLIDSFFDVFTELSLDGGTTWIPSTGPTRVNLVPEPGSLLLVGLGLVPVALAARRRLRARAA